MQQEIENLRANSDDEEFVEDIGFVRYSDLVESNVQSVETEISNVSQIEEEENELTDEVQLRREEEDDYENHIINIENWLNEFEEEENEIIEERIHDEINRHQRFRNPDVTLLKEEYIRSGGRISLLNILYEGNNEQMLRRELLRYLSDHELDFDQEILYFEYNLIDQLIPKSETYKKAGRKQKYNSEEERKEAHRKAALKSYHKRQLMKKQEAEARAKAEEKEIELLKTKRLIREAIIELLKKSGVEITGEIRKKIYNDFQELSIKIEASGNSEITYEILSQFIPIIASNIKAENQ
jgi:hypothetical protein